MDSRIRFAIVGLGFIGKRYAVLIKNNPSALLTAIVDPHETDVALHDGSIKRFHDLTELLESDTPPDVIIIASPNGFHKDQAIQALNAKKHLIIEKPLALSLADAETIYSKAKGLNQKVFSVVPNRYSVVSEWLYQLVSSGRLGQLYMVQVNCFWNRDERYYNNQWRGTAALDGGPLFTQFYHFVDLLHWLFGDLTNIDSRFFDFNHQHLTETEDSGIIRFDFVSGGSGSLNYTTAVKDKNLESSITIIAQNGSVKIGGQYMERIEHCDILGHDLPEAELLAHSSALNNHQALFDDIIKTLRSEEEQKITPEETMKVIEIIDKIYSTRSITKSL